MIVNDYLRVLTAEVLGDFSDGTSCVAVVLNVAILGRRTRNLTANSADLLPSMLVSLT